MRIALQAHAPSLLVFLGMGIAYEVVFVDDGSKDATARMIDDLHAGDPHLSVLHLSRNFGHQPAVSAGLDHARGRAVVIMDGDLQDPPKSSPSSSRGGARGSRSSTPSAGTARRGPSSGSATSRSTAS